MVALKSYIIKSWAKPQIWLIDGPHTFFYLIIIIIFISKSLLEFQLQEQKWLLFSFLCFYYNYLGSFIFSVLELHNYSWERFSRTYLSDSGLYFSDKKVSTISQVGLNWLQEVHCQIRLSYFGENGFASIIQNGWSLKKLIF